MRGRAWTRAGSRSPLASLLAFGALARDFTVTSPQLALTFAAALLTQAAWQWGLQLPGRAHWQGYLSAVISTIGIAILVRADSLWDVSLAFLFAWSALLAARLVWLVHAWDIGLAMWAQQVSNGATLLFAFFVISDPMTTPQRAGARVAYACAVAAAAFTWQHVFFKPHGLILMLVAASLAVPVINWRWPERRFAWAA